MTDYSKLLQSRPNDDANKKAAEAWARQFVLDNDELFSQLKRVVFNPQVSKTLEDYIRAYMRGQGFSFEQPWPHNEEYVSFSDHDWKQGVGYKLHEPYTTDLGQLIKQMRADIKAKMQPQADTFANANFEALSRGNSVRLPDSGTFKNLTYYQMFVDCLVSGGLTYDSDRGERATVRLVKKDR